MTREMILKELVGEMEAYDRLANAVGFFTTEREWEAAMNEKMSLIESYEHLLMAD